MIIVTPAGSEPLTGRVRGVLLHRPSNTSVCEALWSAWGLTKEQGSGILYVASGGKVATAPVWKFMQKVDFDVAACVERIGSTPGGPVRFDGIGRISLETVLLRTTSGGFRFLERWRARNLASPGREEVNLCVVLAELPDLRFRFLGPEWRWRNGARTTEDIAVRFEEATAATPAATPKIEELSSAKKAAIKKLGPGVNWVGHLYQWTGYGKMNREILFRVSNSMAVHLDDSHKEPCYIDEDTRRRLDVHKNVLVDPRAPLLRVMGPDWITTGKRHRICYSMQESSERVHPDMVKRANENFDEIWTPTEWNAQVFRDSGVKPLISVIPLGVDTAVYRPSKRRELPPCRLISDRPHRGKVVVPNGFTFLTIGLPGFRKGWEVIADAMELAFAKQKTQPNLVIGLTHSPGAWNEKVYKQFAKYKFPIWTLEGSFTEHELAGIYNSVDAYVSASRGEGMNLPALEAAACGLPVVVPDNTAHTEIFGPECYLFKPDGVKLYPEGDWISDWYKGMLFSRFGKPSIRSLALILLGLQRGEKTIARTTEMRRRIERDYTWDRCAQEVVRRLLEVQP